MKKYLFLAITLFFAFENFAQDIIVLKNGDEKEVKVIEINSKEIKYKKISNINGPIYTIEKDLVFMIKYENGEKDIITPPDKEKKKKKKLELSAGYYQGNTKLKKKEFKKILFTNPKAKKEFQTGENLFFIGILTETIGAIMLVDAIIEKNNDMYLPGGLAFGAGIGTTIVGQHYKKLSIKTYNNSISFIPYIKTNAIGIVIKF